jgi:hypothetical protein
MKLAPYTVMRRAGQVRRSSGLQSNCNQGLEVGSSDHSLSLRRRVARPGGAVNGHDTKLSHAARINGASFKPQAMET